MIQPHELPGSSNIIDLGAPIVVKSTAKYKPYGRRLILAYEKPSMIGKPPLPGNAKPVPECGEVKVPSVGHTAELVKPGDKVVMPTQFIREAKHNGAVVFYCGEEQILAVVE